MVFPNVKVASLSVRNDRLLLYLYFNQFTRPFGDVSTFTREDLWILRRHCRAFFNDDQRMFLSVRLPCCFARDAICHACDAFPAELRLFFTKRYLTMRVGVLHCRIVARMEDYQIGRVPLGV